MLRYLRGVYVWAASGRERARTGATYTPFYLV